MNYQKIADQIPGVNRAEVERWVKIHDAVMLEARAERRRREEGEIGIIGHLLRKLLLVPRR